MGPGMLVLQTGGSYLSVEKFVFAIELEGDGEEAVRGREFCAQTALGIHRMRQRQNQVTVMCNGQN